jgi:hypothetical protein
MADSSKRFVVDQRTEWFFVVLGPNPDASKAGTAYTGKHLSLCTTDSREDAELIAAALNAYPPAQGWPENVSFEQPRRREAAGREH